MMRLTSLHHGMCVYKREDTIIASIVKYSTQTAELRSIIITFFTLAGYLLDCSNGSASNDSNGGF